MQIKRKIYKVGYTTGVFDLFHIGHLNLLKNAKELCDYLIVGITTDELVMELKGRKPVIPFEERSQIVAAIKYVNQTTKQNRIDELGDYEALNFDVIMKGSDWEGSEKWNSLEKEFEKKGVNIHFFPYTKTTSSTIIRKTLKKVNY